MPTARRYPREGWARLRGSAVAIVQLVVAASAAFSIAHYGLGHPAPLIAATVTISSLGLVRDARPWRVLETVIGMVLGVFVAELVVFAAGSGWWQLALTLGVSLSIARFVSPQAGFAIAAAIQSIIVVVVPSQTPFLRLLDAVIGGAMALLVTALIPRSPLRTALADATRLFSAFEGAAGTVAQGLRRGSRVRAERGLEKARELQGLVDDWRVSVESGAAIARISPFLRRQRFELERFERMRQAMDLAVRNLRVVARRAVYLSDDGRERDVAADLLLELVRGANLVASSLTDISYEPAAREVLTAVAARLDPVALVPDGSLGDQTLITALRPLATDLLCATGLRPDEARALLPRV
ncbi:FUSC family protein [Microbacterium sp. CnD16-F]|uniref:FUSC family protein n=1 Tax=Microbacterium sp. CnD16-F TaxID=2954493 RepID=UPI0020983984|nr:FUSC family protein [Microbacterium sp. CnD16-F]MCO7202272.1 FUSC family protein [Microbacterium sp. CnD16-F]